MENTEIIICGCGSPEHQIIVHHDKEDRIVYLHIHLTSRPFWYRFKAGLKYIFGHTSRYGHWDELILEKGHIQQFEQIVDTLKNV
jgi:hypothetical protein